MKYIAKQLLIEVETATPATFAAIPQVASIDLPQGDTEEQDVTTLDNETNTREFLQGFEDGGECTLELVLDPATHLTGANSIWQMKKTGAVRNFRVGLPEAMATRATFSGYVKSAAPAGITAGQPMKMNATIRVTP
jgi:hypothetical protein